MYAVIFRAEFADPDEDYEATAIRLRDLALTEYGCREFIAHTEGRNELAISYWDSEEQIQNWKRDPIHREAQRKGREKWYSTYTVQVLEVQREYHSEHQGE